MEPPDYYHDDFDDEDAMINDYIDDGMDEPPLEEDTDEWMHVGNGAAAVTTAAAAAPPTGSDILQNIDGPTFNVAGEGRAMTMELGEHDEMWSDDEYLQEHPVSTVHLNFARKRRNQKDPYAFERYVTYLVQNLKETSSRRRLICTLLHYGFYTF